MEQKRVLWIVAAVGLFLLVVIGTALWISSPVNRMQPALSTVQVAGNSWSRSNTPVLASNADLYGVNTSTSATDAYSMQSPSTVNLNNLDASSSSPDASASSAAQPEPTLTPASNDSHNSSAGMAQTAVTLNVNITPTSSSQTAPATSVQTVQPATNGTVSNPQVSANTSATSAPKTTSGAAASSNTTNNNSASSTVASASQTVSTIQASAAAPKATASVASNTTASNNVKTIPTNQPDQFWVQVASFTGKKNAEDARAALAEQKIIGEVFTYQDAKGTIYYRLRVGPYKTKSEAEYWHKIIKEVEQFKGTDSYVVNSTVR